MAAGLSGCRSRPRTGVQHRFGWQHNYLRRLENTSLTITGAGSLV